VSPRRIRASFDGPGVAARRETPIASALALSSAALAVVFMRLLGTPVLALLAATPRCALVASAVR
jgi:hypothetical protein